jgi:CO/xanthine dehydrogenase Mo-binding subunit
MVNVFRIMQNNFNACPLLWLDECQVIDVAVIDSDHSPGGIRVPGLPPTASAAAIIVFELAKRPVRRSPICVNS